MSKATQYATNNSKVCWIFWSEFERCKHQYKKL
jgi:hypothetical protein